MARYDYRCPQCGKQFEVEHPMSVHPRVTCPSCGAEAERVFAPSMISFKGSGFYNTDQRGSGSSTEATSSVSSESDSSSASSSSKCAGCAGGSCANCAG
jgi:putative FmdB family regulatory protein